LTTLPVSPWSSYRVQLHAGFGFRDAGAIAAYLAELGITHLYCSPYLQAAAGSTHGYDVVDPGRFNEELGGAAGHAELVGALRTAGLGQLLDIVPNHMATAPGNRWWWDVLENGPASLYARFFDIDWEGGDDKSAFTVLVPVLGDHYGRVLEAGELQLARHGGDLVVCYFDHELPVSPRTLDGLLAAAARRAGSAPLATIAEGFGSLPSARITDTPAITERHDRKLTLAGDLEQLSRADATVAEAVDAEVAAINADPDRLDALLRRQNYRLAHWKTASEELDYRRFFNIETLVGVRIEDPAVFDETHRLILELVADGTVDGLRIDHVDGLRDPEGYLATLAERTDHSYTVVEKILEADESLPETWPVAGTSGYDFLIRVNDLFVDAGNEPAMTVGYAGFTGETGDYEEVVQSAKQQIMGQELASELQRLTGLVAELSDRHRRHRDHTRRDLSDALRELVARFPVYRTYVHPGRATAATDRRHVAEAVKTAVDNRPDLDEELVGFLGELALGEHPGGLEAEFVQRFQQFTAPVMAKGVEDTAFYRYHRLLSLNEVGGHPGVFGRPSVDFHAATAATAAHWPHSMLTLSTHDTKRSADVRARINVLSELPQSWSQAVQRWADANDSHRRDGWLDRNAEYLLYQSLVGAWPIDAERMTAFMAKATKEAKAHTSWTDPVAEYDAGVEAFVRSILADHRFVEDLEQWLSEHRIVERGRRNSLAQTALLLTCPGVADIYQGSEVWDLSLVDPDNRRPVDYEARRRLLQQLQDADAGDPGVADLGGGADTGLPKLRLIYRVLAHRRARPELYLSVDYEPLSFKGRRANEAVGFHRGALAVVVPRLGDGEWADTTVELPAGRWTEVIGGSSVDGGHCALDHLLGSFPVSVLVRDNG
jgi:(1->4)-alpha-D-glucan 1-alpha-D-glucosylmutase